ncbi:MAG: PKD domain-containing protein [bacterium]|nr:PKD domain-containing protein [bacterium]
MKKIYYILIIFLILIGFSFVQETQSGSGDNVSGWAWSENIGWISFNNTSGGGATSYGVNIDSSTGVLSGHAWSENIGWISFNRSDAGAPPAAPDYVTYLAKIDLATKEFSGWARVLSACQDDLWSGTQCTGSGAGNRAGGWTGWIKLRGISYGVSLDDSVSPAEFRVWAWSDMVLGWLSFNMVNCDGNKDGWSDGTPVGCPAAGTPISDYKVITGFSVNQPPLANSLSASTGNYCTAPSPPVFLSWIFSDSDPGDIQSAYQVQTDNNFDFSSPEIDTGKVLSSSNTYAPLGLSYNATYYWRVKVWDSKDAASNWTTGPQFTTANHAYPSIDFTWLPVNPLADQNVLFTDQSTVYGGASKQSWSWIFTDGNPLTSASATSTVRFISSGSKAVSLQVTDSDSYICSISKNVNVGSSLPFPNWREILPF